MQSLYGNFSLLDRILKTFIYLSCSLRVLANSITKVNIQKHIFLKIT